VRQTLGYSFTNGHAQELVEKDGVVVFLPAVTVPEELWGRMGEGGFPQVHVATEESER